MKGTNEAIAWFRGYVQAKAESFANGVGISPELLTEGLGGVVQSSRERIGNRVSNVPENPTKVGRKLLSTATVDSSTSSRGPQSVKKLRSRGKQKGWWAKNFPTPESRAAEVARRRSVALAKKAGK